MKTLLELVLLSGSVSRGFCLICVVNGSETTINDLLESCGLAMGLNLSLKEVNQFFFYQTIPVTGCHLNDNLSSVLRTKKVTS